MGDRGPGVVVFDAGGGVVLRNPAAHDAMDDLCGSGPAGAALDPVRAAAARLGEPCPAGPHEPTPVSLVRGGSGAWYALHASRAESAAGAGPGVVVTIERVPAGAGIAIRLYGLTPREREIAEMAARGASTKVIAATLGLSPYTVQEHVGNACQKMGVRGRRALVARLFLGTSVDEEAKNPN